MNVRSAMILPVLLTLAAPLAAAPPQLGQFSADMLAEVRKALPQRQVALDPADPLTAKVARKGTEEELTIHFDRAWRYCQEASVEDCQTMRTDFVAKMLAPRPKATARALRFIVRDRQYVDAIKAMDQPAKGQVAAYTRKIGDDLFMILAVDAKDSVGLAGSSTLKELGLSEADAWLIAVPQTRSILPRIADGGALAKQWHAYQGQAYLASLLGLTDDWAELAKEVGPDLFGTAPSDQLAVFGKVETGEPLQKLQSGAQNDCRAAERCISPNIYRFREGRWVIARSGDAG